MVKQQVEIIESISQKLNNKISVTEIIKWLNNFEENDWNNALTVLNQIEYYSYEDSIRELDASLLNIVKDFEKNHKYDSISKILNFLGLNRTKLFKINPLNKKLILHPIGEFTKSGTSMFYLIKQTPTYKNHNNYFDIAENATELSKKLDSHSHLILVDDIIGSGKSLEKYYISNLASILKTKKTINVKKIILSIVYLEKSKTIISKYNFKIYGNLRMPVFIQEGSVFGYRPKAIAIRKFCYKYGEGLYTTKDNSTNKIIDHPLGHNNSQALIVFSHSTPNNTLPIIWSSKKKWHPIFPRFGQDKINLSLELKYDSRKWISILKNNGFENLFENENRYEKINLQQLIVLRLMKNGKNEDDICQILGLNNTEYYLIIQKGIINNIFKKDKTITEFGNNIYNEIKKKEILSRKKTIELKTKSNDIKNIYYLPSSFRGFK